MKRHTITALAAALGTLFCGCRTAVNLAPSARTDGLGRYTVRAFGAKADGQTDDTKAFQAALDAAAKVSGTVFVPAGTYRVGTLVWHDFTSMIGDPGWSYYLPGGSVLELNDPQAECLIDFTKSNPIIISTS